MVDRSPLDINLRLGHIRRAQRRAQPRLSQNLRQLGAVGPYVPAPPVGSQQAVVHGWFGTPHTTGGHLTYLHHGKGPEKTHAPLFTAGQQPADLHRFVLQGARDPHQFRFSLSLHDTPQRFDVQRYVCLVMQRVERDLGRPLDWVAAVHHDTPHPHAHVVLRGRDRDGQALYVAKDYLSHGLRYRAMEIATILLGPMQRHEREQNREIDRTPQHVTSPTLEPKRIDQQRGKGMGIDG